MLLPLFFIFFFSWILLLFCKFNQGYNSNTKLVLKDISSATNVGLNIRSKISFV
ncbi:unnamed protein product [Arabidopsis halleri]